MPVAGIKQAALAWYDAGCSVWPPAQDGTKRPQGEWKRFMTERAPRTVIENFYSGARYDGVGIICGKISGNLEMLELEGRATDSESLSKINLQVGVHGVIGLWEDLLNNGYAEWTPSGGIHVLYRVTDPGFEVPGNTKIARRLATPQELEAKPDDRYKTLAETRGEGGYVIVAPSGGTVHPSGDTWSTFAGTVGTIPMISREQRDLLHQAIHAALDEIPEEPEFTRPVAPRALPLDAAKPGDDFTMRTDWADILQPHGWRVHHTTMSEVFWTRPGKKRSDGWSATTGFAGTGLDDRLYVWSSSTVFQQEKPYSKFGAYTLLEHGGDFTAAARELGSRGYGTQRPPVVAATLGATPVDVSDLVPMPMPPSPGAGAQDAGTQIPATPIERPMIIANDDRLLVWKGITKCLQDRWNGERLFDFGGVICERRDTTMRPLNRAALDSLTTETCNIVNRKFNQRTQIESFPSTAPEARMLDMILSRPEEFVKLEKLSQVPFVRPDGTICATEGYDAATHTFLELDPVLRGIDVPETPSKEQVLWAKDLLLNELLGDFPLHTDSDKANALATLLTPFVRDLVPVSPLAVIDAKEAGSGKNLLADIISVLFTGRSIQTLPYSTDDAEQRKVITSAFRDGHSVLLFDEAHQIEGANFARALTSHSYQDRILGSSVIAEFPNNRTWISLGNQVQIKGDMARRVYRVRLEYEGSRPESRPASSFRHPDLRQWAHDNRAQLVRACLILVRAWYALNRPTAPLPFRMGSFEKWQEILAGILWVAGVPDFLANVPQWRSESDFDRQHTVGHLQWLAQQYAGAPFTAAQATEALKRDRTAEHPPAMDDPFQEGYARRIGQWYARAKDRVLDGLKLIKLEGQAHTGVAKWMVIKVEEQRE